MSLIRVAIILNQLNQNLKLQTQYVIYRGFTPKYLSGHFFVFSLILHYCRVGLDCNVCCQAKIGLRGFGCLSVREKYPSRGPSAVSKTRVHLITCARIYSRNTVGCPNEFMFVLVAQGLSALGFFASHTSSSAHIILLI